jgi:hypothetical protein
MGNLSLVVTRHRINLFTLHRSLTELLPHVLAEMVARRSVSYLRNKHSRESVHSRNLPWLSHSKHPFRYLTARSSHDVDDTFQVWCIFLGKVCNCFTGTTSTTRSTDSVNIALHCLREIVVDDEIDSLEVKTTCHQLG